MDFVSGKLTVTRAVTSQPWQEMQQWDPLEVECYACMFVRLYGGTCHV